MSVAKLIVRVSLVWLIATSLPFVVTPAAEVTATELSDVEIATDAVESVSVSPRRAAPDAPVTEAIPAPSVPAVPAVLRPHASPLRSDRHLHVSLCRFLC